eukprot:7190266-Prymnesium_polylepis.1
MATDVSIDVSTKCPRVGGVGPPRGMAYGLWCAVRRCSIATRLCTRGITAARRAPGALHPGHHTTPTATDEAMMSLGACGSA